MNWLLMVLSFLLGLVLTWLWMVRSVTREVPRYARGADEGRGLGAVGTAAAVGGGAAAAGAVAAGTRSRDRKVEADKPKVDAPEVSSPKVETAKVESAQATSAKVESAEATSATGSGAGVGAGLAGAAVVGGGAAAAGDRDANLDANLDADRDANRDADRDANLDADRNADLDVDRGRPVSDEPRGSTRDDMWATDADRPQAAASSIDEPTVTSPQGAGARAGTGADSGSVSGAGVGAGLAGGAAVGGGAVAAGRHAGGGDADGSDIQSGSDREPAASTSAPYGDGSARADASGYGPAGFRVKGLEGSRVYHPETSTDYARTRADVWFRSEETARAAGFTAWDAAAVNAGAATTTGSVGTSSDDKPFGDLSARPAADGAGPAGYVVKGNEDSMLYHDESSPSYAETKAEVWFRDVAAAEAAGFNRWDSGKSQKKKR